MLFWAAVFLPVYLSMGGVKCAIVLGLGCTIAVFILVCLRVGISTRLCGNMLCATVFLVYTLLSILCGGRSAPTTIWYLSMPVLSLAVRGASAARFWSLNGLFAIIAFTVLDYGNVSLVSELGQSQLRLLHALGLAALLLCFYMLAYLMMKFERHSRELLRDANRCLQLESSSDPLTNVANRRSFDRTIEREWKIHLREQFLHGHLAGDRVLRQVAAAIQAGVRRRDVVARFGGEEFVVILPNTHDGAAPQVTERIRHEIEGLEIDHPHSSANPKVTISIGTATVVPSHDRSHLDLLRHADRALYIAKAAGRDRVVHTVGLPPTAYHEATNSFAHFGAV